MKKEQLKNTDNQDLAMARQALGQVEQMDLTSKEKEEVMKMIVEARKEEKAGNKAKALNLYNQLLRRLKEIKAPLPENLILTAPDGGTVEIKLQNELKYWKDFYFGHGIDWVNLPESINLSKANREKLQAAAQALCPDGDFPRLMFLIIPEGLADSAQKLQQFETICDLDGFNFYGEKLSELNLKNKSDKLRFVMAKSVEDIRDDKVYKQTEDLSLVNLTAEGGFFERNGLQGIDVATYLIWQMDSKETNGRLLDTSGKVWLTENTLPSGAFHDPQGVFAYVNDGGLFFQAASQDYCEPHLGCRLACTIEIEDK